MPRTKIQDKWADLPSATARWRARQRELGYCMRQSKNCTKKRTHGLFCETCAIWQRNYYQQRRLKKARNET